MFTTEVLRSRGNGPSVARVPGDVPRTSMTTYFLAVAGIQCTREKTNERR